MNFTRTFQADPKCSSRIRKWSHLTLRLSGSDGSVLTTCILDNRMPKVSKRMLTDKTFRRIQTQRVKSDRESASKVCHSRNGTFTKDIINLGRWPLFFDLFYYYRFYGYAKNLQRIHTTMGLNIFLRSTNPIWQF